MEKESNVVMLDGIEYTEINRIINDNNTYVMLVNLNNPKDFCIKKLVLIDGESYVKGLDNPQEFNNVFKMFTEKNMN